MQQQGLIRHLGLSTVSLDQLAEAQRIAPVVCVQSLFNIANRADAAGLAATAEQHIAYVPYFPLGSFSPLQSDVVESVAKRLGGTPMAVAQSWLRRGSVLRCSGRANHRDPVTPPHLPGGKPGSGPPPGRKFSAAD
jgi:pyridoxine 4-dehydrogenase